MPLNIVFGNAVTGDQRFPRPELESRLMRLLDGGAGVKMFDLRRLGKSTLRQYAIEQFDAQNRPYVFVDCQGLHSPGDFLSRLVKLLPQDRGVVHRALGILASGPAQQALEALSKGTVFEERTLAAYWRAVSDALRDALKGEHVKPALVVDEFPLLISNMAKRDAENGRKDADRLLASLREWRGAGMTMLLTGSIGLTGLCRELNLTLDHINDLHPFGIPELTDAEARKFVEMATDDVAKDLWTDEHTDEFLRQSGVLYPCFLALGLLEINHKNPPPPEKFAEIFAEKVRPNLHNDFFNQFNRRFRTYETLPDQERDHLFLPVLKTIMEAKGACDHDSLPCPEPFSRVQLALALEMLTEDGFLRFTEDAEGERLWKPGSRLARLWWKRSKLA